jgi:MFS family permease
MTQAVPLRRDPIFRRWASAEAISLVGTAISTVVIPILVFQRTGSPAQTGAVTALRVVPYLLVGLVAGPLADRLDRRALIVWGNVAQGGAMAVIPIVDAITPVPIPVVYAASFASATAFVFSDAAVFGALPALIGDQRLPAANGLLTSIQSAALMIGPALGGLLATTIGAASAVWFDVASFFIAAAVLGAIRAPFSLHRVPEPRSAGLGEQVRRGLRFIRQERTILTLIVIGFGNSFAFGVMLGLVVPYAVDRLGVPDNSVRLGLLFTADALGALLAGLTFARIYARDRIRWLTPLCLGVSAALLVLLTANTSYALALVLTIAFAFAVSTTISVGITYRQMASPDELRSSVNVVGRMVAWGGQPFGAAVGGIVAQTAGVPTALGMAAGVMTASAIGAVVLLGHRRQGALA